MPRPLLIFDIDGTLTDTNRVDGDCYQAAIREVYGTLDHRDRAGDYQHVTDEGILAETLADNGLTWDDTVVEAFKARFVAMMAAVFATDPPRPIPGVPAFLAWLDVAGIPWCAATGAWFASGRLKLDRAGLVLADEALTASDGLAAKYDILSRALTEARRRLGVSVEEVRPIYLGDRLYDLTTAQDLGWSFIGVGTRLRDACEAAGCAWIADFSRGRVVLEQVLDPGGDPLGLGRTEVRLVDHDPRWAGIFAAEAQRLRSACGAVLVDVQHFGSTAIPGLKAKPMVDILAAVPAMADAASVRPVLESLGYEFRPEAGHARRAVFIYGSPSRFHLHLTTVDTRSWRQNLHFRDRLCADPGLAREYEAVKLRCLAEHPADRPAYTEAKGAFIRVIKDEA